MAKRKRYDEEFKKDAVRLLQNRGTRTVADIATQLGVHTSFLVRWRQEYAGDIRGEAVRHQEQREDVEQLRRCLRELEAENSLLKSRSPIRQGGEVAMFELVHAEREELSVARACRNLGVSRSGYYRWLNAPPPKTSKAGLKLEAEIRAIHGEHRGRYGSPRIHRELAARGIRVGRKRVARVMTRPGLRGWAPQRFRRRTNSNHKHRIAKKLLERDFSAAAPNLVWVGV